MNDLVIERESAMLIIGIFQKINILKKRLDQESFHKMKELIDSGSTLHNAMNSAMEESSQCELGSKLAFIIRHLNKLTNIHRTLQISEPEQGISELFEQLKAEIILLQSKLNAKQ